MVSVSIDVDAPTPFPSDIEIAEAADITPVVDLAQDTLGIPAEALVPYGHTKAKVSLGYLRTLEDRPDGHLVLVTAMSPTPAGEGKTTTSVGLADALRHIGEKSVVALREPSMGPVFGIKGGAAGGGYSQVVPMVDINLAFTGDFAAIAAKSPVKARLMSTIGTTWLYPPPAAPPLMPNTGPIDGSRRATTLFSPIRRRASASPTEVVVLPSPAGVGLIAVTSTRCPSGRPSSERR